MGYTQGWLIIVPKGTIINCQGDIQYHQGSHGLTICSQGNSNHTAGLFSSQCWHNNVHLAMIEIFVLEGLGVLNGAAVRVTIAK